MKQAQHMLASFYKILHLRFSPKFKLAKVTGVFHEDQCKFVMLLFFYGVEKNF
jgi:hypothetical protein